MSAIAVDPTADLDRRLPFATVRDTLAVAQRNLIHYVRIPQLLVFSTIQPVVFVLLWRYVFGGAIGPVAVPGTGLVPYVDFLMAGIFVQTVVFGAIGTGVGLAADLKSGMFERFLSLPMSRSAVLIGRTIADLARNVIVVVLMVAVGFAVGFRIHTNVGAFVLGLLLVVLFGYALSWVFAAMGLLVKDPESAQAAAFPLIAPLVFASTAFVPILTMPGWLQAFARNQPVSVTVEAVRALTVGGPTWDPVAKTLLWCAAMVVVFGTVAVRLYRRAV